jgi:hypothetical protein
MHVTIFSTRSRAANGSRPATPNLQHLMSNLASAMGGAHWEREVGEEEFDSLRTGNISESPLAVPGGENNQLALATANSSARAHWSQGARGDGAQPSSIRSMFNSLAGGRLRGSVRGTLLVRHANGSVSRMAVGAHPSNASASTSVSRRVAAFFPSGAALFRAGVGLGISCMCAAGRVS